MEITIKVKIDTGDDEPSVVAYATGSDLTGSAGADTPATESGSVAEAPPADLLARAQAIGASNAGAAPTAVPEGDGPPVFTGSAPPVAMDEASYAEGLSTGATDVSAGPAPGTTTEDDLAVVTDAIPGSGDDAEGATDAGSPTRRAAKKTASRSTKAEVAGRTTATK